MSGGHQGALTTPRRGQGGARLGMVWTPGARLRLPFGLRVLLEKIGTSVFAVSNSENISRTTFLKPKIAENMELTLGHLVNRLVPENI